MTLLDIRGLSIRTPDGHTLVDDVSFHIERGEILGIVGESGSGKSLSCRSALGIVPAPLETTAAHLVFDDIDLRSLTARQWRRLRGTRIGAVFQDPGSYLNPSLSVGRQLAEVHRVKLGLPRREAWTAAVRGLGDLGIVAPERVAHLLPKELSGGMLQRSLIAIAIAESPQLLIADEPTTALDATVQSEVLDVLHDLRDSTGLAVLFVSHDLAAVAGLCERLIVMQHGRIVEQGETNEVIAAPQHVYTQALLQAHAEYGLEHVLSPVLDHV